MAWLTGITGLAGLTRLAGFAVIARILGFRIAVVAFLAALAGGFGRGVDFVVLVDAGSGFRGGFDRTRFATFATFSASGVFAVA